MALFKKKEVHKYKVMERYRIDISKTNRLYNEGKSKEGSWGRREFCHVIAEGQKYIFYGYRTFEDGSGGYVLRQEKDNPRKIVFFGDCRLFNCVFHDYLFQVNREGEIGRFGITARHVASGNQIRYNWLSERANYIAINGYGRFYSQDTVEDVYVKDGKLVFRVSRKKSNDPHHKYEQSDCYDIDVKYDLIVEYVSGEFKATAIFPSCKEIATNDAATNISDLERMPSNRGGEVELSPEYVDSLFKISDAYIGKYVQVMGTYSWLFMQKDANKCNLVEYSSRSEARILVELEKPLPDYIVATKAYERYPIVMRGIIQKERGTLTEYTLKQGVYYGYWRDDTGRVVCVPGQCKQECSLDCPIFANRMGEEQSQLRNFSDAKELFQKALKIASDYWLPWCNLGQLHLREEKYEDAFEAFHTANKLWPNEEKCLYGLVISLAKINRLKEAEDYLFQYQEMFPTSAGAELQRIVLDCADKKADRSKLSDEQYVQLFYDDYEEFWNLIHQEKESTFATIPCKYDGAIYRTRCEHLKRMTRMLTHGKGEELLRMRQVLISDAIPNAKEMCMFDVIDEYERRYIKY